MAQELVEIVIARVGSDQSPFVVNVKRGKGKFKTLRKFHKAEDAQDFAGKVATGLAKSPGVFKVHLRDTTTRKPGT